MGVQRVSYLIQGLGLSINSTTGLWVMRFKSCILYLHFFHSEDGKISLIDVDSEYAKPDPDLRTDPRVGCLGPHNFGGPKNKNTFI